MRKANGVGKTDVHKRMKSGSLYPTQNQKWINISTQGLKLQNYLRKTHGKIFDIGQSLSWILHQNTSNESKDTHTWDYIKFKSFFIAKETVKRQSVQWEKIVANHVSVKG